MTTRILLLGMGIFGLVLLGSEKGAERLKAGSGPSRSGDDQLPTYLRWVRENATSRPPPEIRREARPEDKGWLMREYRRQPTLYERIASAWLLAYIGDDEVFRLFSEGLRLGRGSRWIDESELAGLNEQLYGMGVIAQTNDLAFEFLKEGVNPNWWRKERRWRVKWRQPGKDDNLAEIAGRATFAIEALGLRARPEAGLILDRMKREGCRYVSAENPRERWNLAPATYTAKCYLEVSRRMGIEAFRDGLFGGEFKRHSMEWRRSEEGMKWLEWCYPKDKWPWMWEDIQGCFKSWEKVSD